MRAATKERREPTLVRSSLEDPRVSIGDPAALQKIFGEEPSSAGIVVSEARAMRLSTVYTCVRILAETLASLPLHIYERGDSGKAPAPRHRYQYLLHDSPNEWTTSMVWRELGMAHVLLWGNSYSRLDWSNGGQLLGIYQLLPWQVQPYRKGGTLRYRVQLEDGIEELPAEDVLHVPGLGYDGLMGLSVIRDYARNTLGLAIGAEDYGGRLFANDARPGLVLTHPGQMKQDAYERLKSSVGEQYGGKNRFRPMILEEGMTAVSMPMPAKDAQFLETRKQQRSEIFGLYRVPPHMGGDLERATFSNIEHQDIAFAKHTMRPWCVRWEQELNRKLFGRGSHYFVEFNLDGLMRGDFKSRMEGYQIGVGGPFLTVDEVRSLENLPPTPGGEQRLVPVNMAPVGKDGKPVTISGAKPAEPLPPKPGTEPEQPPAPAESEEEQP